MLVIVIPLALALLFLISLKYGLYWRQAVVGSALVGGVWVAGVTELLSFFNVLNRAIVAFTWAGLVASLAVFYWRHRSASFIGRRPKLAIELWALLFGVGLIALGTGLTAILSPPNTWDSMTYHMSRVMHWIQNGTVAFYPTYIARQLYQPPLAEWVITHLQLLSGGDYLANLVQWFSWIGCLITTSLIARELGAKRRGQILTVVIAATINMGILQSSSTQNDLVVAFWISCGAYISLYGVRNGFRWASIIGLGAAIGLSVLSKGTAYVYIAPFMLWVMIYAWRKQRRDIWKYGFALAAIALALNIGQYSRNWRGFGSPMGGETSYYANQAMSPSLWVSVVVRNLALHVAVQPELDAKIGLSQRVYQSVAAIHRILGLSVDDPRVTLQPEHFAASFLLMHEDQTAAPAQLTLAVLAFGLCVVRIRSFRIPSAGIYGLAVVLAFGLFCLTLRWQPWNNRLHLPWFILLSPFIAIVLERYLHRYMILVICLYLLYLGAFPTLFNQSRPLVGNASVRRNDRWSIMFYNRPELQASYTDAVEQIQQSKCEAVGLKLGLDTWEYPLWARAAEQGDRIRFTYVQSTLGMPHEFEPCAVVASKEPANEFGATMTVGERTYKLSWHDVNLAVYLADE